jgi:WD40 repeat protein
MAAGLSWLDLVSPDGRWLATGSDDSTIAVTELGSDITTYVFTGHSQGVSGLDFSPDGTLLASSSWDGLIKIWDMRTGQERFTLFGPGLGFQTVAYSPDGKYVAGGGTGPSIEIYLAKLEDIVALAHSRLTRNLTTDECQQYLRLDTCPSLPSIPAFPER